MGNSYHVHLEEEKTTKEEFIEKENIILKNVRDTLLQGTIDMINRQREESKHGKDKE